jgi:hypothetical protein
MAINFPDSLYTPNYNVFSRLVTFTPLASQPGQPAYDARGIYGTVSIDLPTEEGIFSDQRTILDVLEKEFSAVPMQGDTVDIPAYQGLPARGTFEIIADHTNGYETTLTLRRIQATKP